MYNQQLCMMYVSKRKGQSVRDIHSSKATNNWENRSEECVWEKSGLNAGGVQVKSLGIYHDTTEFREECSRRVFKIATRCVRLSIPPTTSSGSFSPVSLYPTVKRL
jgi:hypothetical protein